MSEASKAAHILNLDEFEVAKRAKDNRKANYGVVLVAGHGIDGEAGAHISTWNREVRRITRAKVLVDTEFSHSTIGNVCRSQAQKISADGLEGLDLDGVLEGISRCRPFNMHLQQMKLSDRRNGNIILVTQTKDSELGDLRRALKKAKLPLEWDPPEDPQPARAFVTLAHIGINALKCL